MLVNSAGIGAPVDEWEESSFLNMFDVDLHGTIHFARAVRDKVAVRKGAIVNVASML